MKKKISEGLCKTNFLISPSEGSTHVQAHVDVNLNNDRATLAVYSPNEIPRKNQGSSFQMVKSKEAAESSPRVESGVRSNNAAFGVLPEQSVQTEAISKGLHMSVKEATAEDQDASFCRSNESHPLENIADSSISNGILSGHERTNLCSSTHNPCSESQNNFPLQPDSGGKDLSCPSDISICSPSSISPLDFAIQFVMSKGHQEDQGLISFPYTALSTPSTEIIADAARQQRSKIHTMINSELSFKFGSSLQSLPLGLHY